MVLRSLLLCLFFCLGFSSLSCADAYSSRDDLKKFVLQTIRDNPQVLLDILRNNSEAVLDIAQEGSNNRRIKTYKKQWNKDLNEKKNIHLDGRPVLGNKDAKVKIVAFSDFTCHYCQASKSTVDKILQEFKDQVCFIFKSIPFEEKGPSALAAQWFLAIAQQDEEKAWQFYDIMFDQHDALVADNEKFLKKVAKDLKLNISKLETDIKHNKKIKDILKEDRKDADDLNVEGTPCFFVNNIVVRGAQPLDFFRIAVNMALQNAEKY